MMNSFNIKEKILEELDNYYTKTELDNKILNEKIHLIDNLNLMGITNISTTMGLHQLIDKILDIDPSLCGVNVITRLSVNLSETSVVYGSSIVVSGVLEADKDDTSNTNVDLEGYLKGATINIYHDETLIGTAITNGVGEYSFNYNNITMMGTNNIYCVFEGTNYYQECTSTAIPLNVANDLIVTSTKDILSYADNDSTILTATLIGGDVEGKNVVFKNGDTVLDTVVTDSNGVAEYEYTSQGVGDVSINIECMLLQEIFVLRDVYFYDSMTSDSGHWTYDSGLTKSYSSDGVSITSSSDKHTLCDVPLPNNFRLTLKAKSNANNDLRYCVISNWSISNGSYSGTPRFMLFNGWPPQHYVSNNYTQPNIVEFEAEYLNGTLTLKKDGATLITQTVTLNNQLFYLFSGGSHIMTIKDVIIKEL